MNNLDNLRNKINETDDKIVELLLKRFEVVKNVREYKKSHGLEILQKDRETEVLKNISAQIDKTNSREYKEYILEIYETILKTSKESQR